MSFPLQMVASPAHAFLAQSAPASPTALSSAANVLLAILGMASLAKTLMSVKQFLILATHITESIAVKTLSLVITVCPAPPASPVPSLLEEGWNRQLLRNRLV